MKATFLFVCQSFMSVYTIYFYFALEEHLYCKWLAFSRTVFFGPISRHFLNSELLTSHHPLIVRQTIHML